jgi:signal transduction histidine kinase
MKVMVIDDDMLLSDTLKDIIAARGNQVQTFTTAEAAIEAYQETFYSMILIDIGLPGMNGLECCRRIRAHPKGKYSFLLVTTGRTKFDCLRDSLDAGADDYIKKPFNLDLLKIRLEIAEKHGLDRLERMLADKELQRARKMAESASVAKNNFLASVSHELRTPLNGILGYTQILKRDSNMLPKQSNAIETIHECGEHLLTMINDVLDFSSIESQKFLIFPKPFDFFMLLSSVVSIFRMKSIQKGLNFNYQPDNTLPRFVNGDEKRLRQILFNLLSNALKHTIEGQISFRVKKQSDKIKFEVEDSGIGIPVDKMEEIFLPFHQLHDGRIQREGAGLGLSITRTIIRMMGSDIHVKSKEGEGTTFYFQLTLPEAKAALTSEDHSSHYNIIGYQGPVKKVLIVEDIEQSRAFIRDILEPVGFAIKEAVNGREAIRKALSFVPDLILMDLVMPVMQGIEATRKIRLIPTLKNSKIIAVSANIRHETQQECFMAGCDDYITKPVQVDELLELVQEHLHLSWTSEIQSPKDDSKDTLIEQMPIVFPPKDAIQTINKLILSGKTTRLKKILSQIKVDFPECISFTSKAYRLLEQFRLEDIQRLIEKNNIGHR